jgi:hypothetical protein
MLKMWEGSRCMSSYLMVSHLLLSLNLSSWTEMLRTVIASEAYLFTPRELWVLNHILNLPCMSTETV